MQNTGQGMVVTNINRWSSFQRDFTPSHPSHIPYNYARNRDSNFCKKGAHNKINFGVKGVNDKTNFGKKVDHVTISSDMKRIHNKNNFDKNERSQMNSIIRLTFGRKQSKISFNLGRKEKGD